MSNDNIDRLKYKVRTRVSGRRPTLIIKKEHLDKKNEKKVEKPKPKPKKKKAEDDGKDPRKTLKFYLDSMAYRMPPMDKLSTTNFRTELLAKPKTEVIRHLENFQHIFHPKEKVKRIKAMVQEVAPLSTEKLEQILQNERHKNRLIQKKNILREKLYLQTLHKLENQFKSQTMDDLIDKFVDYVSHKCVKYKRPDTMTETMQRLTLIIKRYIFLALAPKTCFWQCDQTSLDTLSMVLTEIIFNILYESQKYKQNSEQTDDILKCVKEQDYNNKCEKNTNLSKNMHDAIHNRSWIAANRKIKKILSPSKEKNNQMFRCM